MASASLLALIDDITTMLDDVSAMTQVAAKKTAGVLGDDLALNAQQVAGVDASRELPVVWAVAKGSFINKLILVPAALIISYFAPWLITPLLMVGGAFLCFEGFEKIWHKLFHANDEAAHETEVKQAFENPQSNLMALEKEKIQGAIRTDFILSAEIIVIALGVVADKPLSQEFMVLALIAIVMTVGVYGLVAAIVKLDDMGLWLMMRQGASILKALLRKVGHGLVLVVPYLMRVLSVLGTAAMFLVGGGIISHKTPAIHHFAETLGSWAYALDGLIGLLVGGICLLCLTLIKPMFGKK